MTTTTTADARELFDTEFDHHMGNQLERSGGLHPDEWRAGGRRSKEYPNKEDQGWWRKHGPKMVADYLTWRERMLEAGWRIWQAPDGRPAVELDLMAVFGEIPVKMGIDRVFQGPDDSLCVVDLKTGSRTPDSDLQLNFYACGMELTFGVRPKYGAYYMARKAEWTGPVPLNTTVAQITAELEMFNKAVDQQLFLPHRSSHCISCSVAYACAAVGGREAHKYDPLHPNYGKES